MLIFIHKNLAIWFVGKSRFFSECLSIYVENLNGGRIKLTNEFIEFCVYLNKRIYGGGDV